MTTPMFSIIVVSLNAGEKLIQTIRNISEQTYLDYEVIVKDGGSQDGSLEALKEELAGYRTEISERFHVYSQPDKSIYEGMNQGVKLAHGRYFYFLNCGDFFYHNNALFQASEEITQREGEGSRALIFYGDIFDVLRKTAVSSNPRINGFACYRNVPCHQACIYHASLFEERGYRPEYRVRADYEHFLWSYYKKKATPTYIGVLLASYEGGGFSETAENRKRSQEEHRAVTAQYMTKGQRFRYRLFLWLTLAPLRTRLAESSLWSGWYQKAKEFLYRK